jgi:hypothetical protein
MITPFVSAMTVTRNAEENSRLNRSDSISSSTTSKASLSRSAEVNISPKAQISKLGDEYDVTNISDNEMKKLAIELKDYGLISEREFADLTLVIKPPGGDYQPDTPRNYLEQFKVQLAQSELSGNNGDTTQLKQLTDLLQSLKNVRNQSL